MKQQQHHERRHEFQLAPTFRTTTTIATELPELGRHSQTQPPNLRLSFFGEHGEGHFEGDARTVIREVTVQFDEQQLEDLIRHLTEQLEGLRTGWTESRLDLELEAAEQAGELVVHDGKWHAPDENGKPVGGGWDHGDRVYALMNALSRRPKEEPDADAR